jgi:hypothetical protein
MKIVGAGGAGIIVLSMLTTASISEGARPTSRVVEITRCERRAADAVRLGGVAWCGNTKDVHNPEYDSLHGDRWSSDRQVRASFIRALIGIAAGYTSPQGIEIHGARITKKLDLGSAKVAVRLALDHSYFEEPINLSEAELTEIELTGTHVPQVIAEHLRTTGSADFGHGFSSSYIHLVDAQIGGFLSFDGARLSNPDVVVMADGLKVASSVTFRAGFVSEGEVRLLKAQIGRNLDAHGGKFLGSAKGAFTGDGSVIGGDVFFHRDEDLDHNFVSAGMISLINTQIGGDIYLNDAEFLRGSTLDLHGATIRKRLLWQTCKRAPVGDVRVDLTDASAGTLADAEACWPQPGHLFLDGFQYRRFDRGVPQDAAARLRWVARQQNASPVVYRQLAQVLSDSGDPGGSRRVLIALEFARRANDRGVLATLWNWTLDLTIGYGYATWRAAAPAFAVILIGWFIFSRAYRSGGITPSDKDAAAAFVNRDAPTLYPPFSALMYTLDSFLPIINFGQKQRWEPNANCGATWWPCRTAGWYARAYLWLHIGLGWLLTTLFVAGITGIVQTK